jgi:8-oxo-dGTP diphosphatase
MLKCTFEDGRAAHHGLRHVVTDCIVIKDSQILLIKRALHLTNGGKWGLAGGYVSTNETVEEAALRELKEEAGYTGKVVKFLEMADSPTRLGDDLNRQNIAIVYLIEAGEKVGGVDEETTEAKWFPLDQLPPEEEIAFDHYQLIQNYLKTSK